MPIKMVRGKTVADRLQALTDFLVSEKISRRQVRECVKTWEAPPVPKSLVMLVKLLSDVGKRVYLKSDGLYELTRAIARQLEVPDPLVSGNSLTFSSKGAVTGVVSFSQGIYSYQANSPAAAVAKVVEHKLALKNAKYAIIGGTEADFAARAVSPHGADVLIALKRDTSSVREREGAAQSNVSLADNKGKADWNAKGVGKSCIRRRGVLCCLQLTGLLPFLFAPIFEADGSCSKKSKSLDS